MSKIHLIVRDRVDATKQMQIEIDTEEHTAGVVCNNGMEMIVIAGSFSQDVGAKYAPLIKDAEEGTPV
jgi:hypothetical protein